MAESTGGYYTEEQKAKLFSSISNNLQPQTDPYSQFMSFFVVFLIIVVVSFILFKIKTIKRRLWDYQVYSFILDFKSISHYERTLLSTLARKYDISKKYDLLTIEATFDRCASIEIIKIEDSDISLSEKEKKINGYNELKKKLFSSDK